MKKVVQSLITAAVFVLASLASFATHADSWPATAQEVLQKSKITVKFGTPSDPIYYVFNLREKKNKLYYPTYKGSLCSERAFSEMKVISEDELEITSVPAKRKDGWAQCFTNVSKVNTKERTFTNFKLEEDEVMKWTRNLGQVFKWDTV